MMRIKEATVVLALAVLSVVALQRHAAAEQAKSPQQMTPAELNDFLAKNPEAFLKGVRAAQKWDEAAEPIRIAGPIYFVDTVTWTSTVVDGDATLKPDSWLHSHTDTMGFEAKRARVAAEGVRAWVDPDGYRKYVAGETAAFQAVVDGEKGVPAKGK